MPRRGKQKDDRPAWKVRAEENMNARYYVTTWDTDRQRFTPQQGVKCGPWSLWGLRKALRLLREMGYGGRRSDNSILVEKR